MNDMNCCKNHNEKEENSLQTGQPNAQTSEHSQTDAKAPSHNHTDAKAPSHNHIKHMMHMVLCCGLPLLILLALPLIGYKGVLLNIVPFICPIMMLVMIPMMMRGQK